MRFEEINKLIAADIEDLQKRMKSEMKSDISLLNLMTDYMLKTKGKQMRPMLVFLTARMLASANEGTIIAATMIELLHTATLIHDDVVDEAETRRGFLSISAKWKNKAAVLLGDFMLSRGLLISLENNQFELLKIMSTSVKEMSEGELLQAEKALKLDISEKVYYEIIAKKTASLIRTACHTGAHSVTQDSAILSKIVDMGYNIGMAFQIKDDLLDLGTDAIGKPLALDIKDQKMTLPLIYTLSQCGVIEKTKLLGIMRFRNKNNDSIQTVIKAIQSHGGLTYAENKMNEFAHKAKEILLSFPENEYRQGLLSLIDYTVERKN